MTGDDMNVYVDLSFLGLLLNALAATLYTASIVGKRRKLLLKIAFIFASSLVIIFYRSSWYLGAIYLLIIVCIYYQIHIKEVLIYFFFYFSVVLIESLFINQIHLAGILPLAKNTMALFIYISMLLAGLIMRFVLIKLCKYIRHQQFTYQFILISEGKSLKLKGYYDSGNSLTVKELPVIFIKQTNICTPPTKMIEYDPNQLVIGEIELKHKCKHIRQRVLVAKVSGNYDFYGCDCLLNVLLI